MNAKKLILLVAAMALLAVPATLYAAEAPAGLAALVDSVPNADPGGKHTAPGPEFAPKAEAEVLKAPKASVAALMTLMGKGFGNDYFKAHYTLHAAAHYARRPGAEEQRQAISEALCAALPGDYPALVKAHALEELKWIGGKEAIPAVSEFLLDKELYDFAVQALVALRCAPPIRAALPKSAGRNRIALVQALGTLKDAEAVSAIVKETGSKDAAVRLAAREALANIGSPEAIDAILAAAKLTENTNEEMKSARAALLLGQQLVAAGKKAEARRIFTTLPGQCPGKAGRHIRIGCLRGLGSLAGADILNELLTALADPDIQVQSEAARIAKELPGGAMVDKWLDLLATGPKAKRSGVLFVLGAIGDPKALPAVLGAMKDKDLTVRIEATRSAARIGGKPAAEAVLAATLATDGEERSAAIASLAACKGAETDGIIGAAAKSAAKPADRALLIDVLAMRRASSQMPVIVAAAQAKEPTARFAAIKALEVIGGSNEAPVLIAILKAPMEKSEGQAAEKALEAVGQRDKGRTADAMIKGLDGANTDAAIVLCRLLGRSGHGPAAKALVAATGNADAKIKDEAIRALARWSERGGLTEACDGLLQVAKTATEPKQQVLALRGYIGLARSGHLRNDKKRQLAIYAAALPLAKRADEKRAVLGGLTNIQTVESVALAATCLDDKDIAEEAATAVVNITKKLKNKTDDAVQKALAKVVEVSKNKGTVKEAQKHLIKKATEL